MGDGTAVPRTVSRFHGGIEMARKCRRSAREARQPVRPIKRIASYRMYDDRACKAIHDASMQVLAETGVRFDSPVVREILRGAGASIEGETVSFSEELVERALESIPSSIRLCGRKEEDDLVLDGSASHMNLDGNGMDIIDFETGQRRATNLQDLIDATRLGDYLPQISYVWPIATARDCPERVQALHETCAQLKNTTKHVMTMTVSNGLNARGVIEMASLVSGGPDRLRQRPLISTFLCATSPLAFERGACEAILEFARAGLPTGIMTMPISGATAPVTVAGNLVLVNAEVLAGLVLIQTLNPGCPCFYASCTTLMDLKAGGVTSNGPEDYQLQAGTVAMARNTYNIPVMTGIMGTEARYPGWQAGVEDSLSCYTSVLCGADLMPGAGLLKNATTLCYEELVMGCEIYEIVRRTVAGFEISADTLAADVIGRVGPRGDFMTEDHTLKFMRSHWEPDVLRRCSFDVWEESGKKDALERAHEKVRWILENHKPEPLPDEICRGLEGIIRKYERG